MSRRRISADHGLQPRVYFKHGAYYYVHIATGKWENLGKDKDAANRRARLYNDPDGQYGTLVYWLDMFLVDCALRVKAGSLAQRTYDDYASAITGTDKKPGALRLFFAAPITPLDLDPAMVQDFLATNAALGRPVPGNLEKAALSSAVSWLIRTRQGARPGWLRARLTCRAVQKHFKLGVRLLKFLMIAYCALHNEYQQRKHHGGFMAFWSCDCDLTFSELFVPTQEVFKWRTR